LLGGSPKITAKKSLNRTTLIGNFNQIDEARRQSSNLTSHQYPHRNQANQLSREATGTSIENNATGGGGARENSLDIVDIFISPKATTIGGGGGGGNSTITHHQTNKNSLNATQPISKNSYLAAHQQQ
jgi:hypothetical protein